MYVVYVYEQRFFFFIYFLARIESENNERPKKPCSLQDDPMDVKSNVKHTPKIKTSY